MPRPSLVLRAFVALLLALPLRAQTVRVTGPLSELPAAPAITGPGFQPTLTPPALSPLPAAPSLAAALPETVSPTPLEVVIPAAAEPDWTQTPARLATPADGWASRFNFQPGEEFFDGGRALKSETGAVFAAIPKGQGAVRVHLLEDGPLAPTKAVPGTEGLSGPALLDALHTISARGHREHSYEEASDYLFATADHVVINGVSGVVDAYSGIFVPGTSKDGSNYPEPGDADGDGFPDKEGMNVEHTWPQSLFQRALPMRSDLHHLMATFVHPNSVRGNLPFGEVHGTPDYENKAGAKRGGGVFEPPDAVKGRIARGLLYFYSRHKDSRMFGRTSVVFWNQQIELLMKWNRKYPPTTFEARRNDLVEAYQGNRNPFIDDYLLADRVGAEAFRAEIPSRGDPGVSTLNGRSTAAAAAHAAPK